MKRIWDSLVNCCSRLWLGVCLIVLCSAILLFLNRPQAKGLTHNRPQVAILTISSRTVMEDFLRGCHDLFAERGYFNRKTIDFHFYNPQGDLPTANVMADDIVQRKPDMVITASTPMLQVMFNRNRKGTVRHVFGLVTDPFSAIPGLDRKHLRRHPDYIGGYGTFQPVDQLFDLMLKLNPGLKKVGTVRNAGEACSEATFLKAKAYCKQKGIELVDSTVESPAGVKEAVKAIIEAGVQGIWIGGDNTVEAAIELVVNEADKAGIPVFTHSPTHLKFGTAISLGADYYEVARITASLAADVLEGKASLKNQAIENRVPELLALNEAKLEAFTADPAELVKLAKKAAMTVNAEGKVVYSKKLEESAKKEREPAKIHMISYNYSVPCENAEDGFLEGLKAGGLREGVDYKLKRANGSGDMQTLSLLVDAAVTERADLIASFSTPALQTVISRGRNIPTVYSFVTSGVVAGAGESRVKHKKNITGVDVLSPIEELLVLIRTYFPKIRKLGFIYTAGATNSEYYVKVMTKACKDHGFELVKRSCGSSMEVSESFRSVLEQNVDAVMQIPDNNVYAAFETLVNQCEKKRIPLFCNASSFVKKGACLALATDYKACGAQSATLAIRILNGEDPANIPFEKPKKKVLYINKAAFARLGLKLPEELVKKADKVIEK